jgi:hypothetical protein
VVKDYGRVGIAHVHVLYDGFIDVNICQNLRHLFLF